MKKLIGFHATRFLWDILNHIYSSFWAFLTGGEEQKFRFSWDLHPKIFRTKLGPLAGELSRGNLSHVRICIIKKETLKNITILKICHARCRDGCFVFFLFNLFLRLPFRFLQPLEAMVKWTHCRFAEILEVSYRSSQLIPVNAKQTSKLILVWKSIILEIRSKRPSLMRKRLSDESKFFKTKSREFKSRSANFYRLFWMSQYYVIIDWNWFLNPWLEIISKIYIHFSA